MANEFKIKNSKLKKSECRNPWHWRFSGFAILFYFLNFYFLIFNSVVSAQLVKAIESVGITVSDMDRATDFFSNVLSFQKISDVEVAGSEYESLYGVFGARVRIVRMKLGGEAIELMEYIAPKGRPVPIDSRSNDQWFQHIAIVVSDMEKAYQHLRAHKVQHTSTGPQRIPDWNKAAAGIQAFYFKDPDSHSLELIYFPPGKGDPKWQQTNGRLFLGIDHTAIAVSDTERSLKLYRDVLGMNITSASENYGTEQEHLNNVFGSRVRITGLRAPVGFGIEFLDYLTPRDGRRAPADTRANDLWHWQTIMKVSGAEAAAQKLTPAKARLVSPGVVTLGMKKAFMMRDRDGHALQLMEK